MKTIKKLIICAILAAQFSNNAQNRPNFQIVEIKGYFQKEMITFNPASPCHIFFWGNPNFKYIKVIGKSGFQKVEFEQTNEKFPEEYQIVSFQTANIKGWKFVDVKFVKTH